MSFFRGHVFIRGCWVIIALVASAQEQIREGIEPGLVPLARRGGELDCTTGSDNNQALAVQTRWVGVVIRLNPNILDLYALGFKLCLACSGRVLVTPVERACVRVNPEEPPMSVNRHLLATGLARVLPQILSNHRLGNGLHHARIDGLAVLVASNRVDGDVEALVNLRSKRRNRSAA